MRELLVQGLDRLVEGLVALIAGGVLGVAVRVGGKVAGDVYKRQMQGYGTMASEAAAQLAQAGVERPTHIFVQAGVGSLAGAVQGYFANLFPDNCPTTVVMEAQAADCLYRSAQAGDGSIRFVTGDMPTIMAGLACGEPNTIGFDILRNHTAFFVSCPDWVSALGLSLIHI